MNVEDELRSALHAASDYLHPEEVASLTAVRARGRAARRRRALLAGSAGAVAVVAVVALAATRLGGDGRMVVVSEQPSTTATAPPSTAAAATTTALLAPMAPPTLAPQSTVPMTTGTPITSIPATTTPPPPAAEFDRVIWPAPEHAQFDDAVPAARSFVDEFVGMDTAPLGELRLDGPDVGKVDVHALDESGAVGDAVVSTIALQRLDGHWYVTGAVADDVQIDTPAAHAEVTSMLRVQGRGRGFEGTIVIEVRDAFQPAGANLAYELAIAGCCDELMPFNALLSLSPHSGPTGAVVATTDTGTGQGIVDFTVIPVRFAAPSSSEVTTLRVFLTDYADGVAERLVEVQRTVPRTTGVLRASLVALLDGPTSDERVAGLMSWFPNNTGDAVEAVNITDGRATVRLAFGLEELPNNVPPDRVLAQLNANVFQFSNVHTVRYELIGGCDAFDAWLGQGCEFTRNGIPTPTAFLCPEGGLDEVAALQTEVDAGHQPWRTSAPDVAAACTFGQPDATVEPAGENTFRVTDPSTGQTVIVTVTQPLRTGDTGVWAVTSVVPDG